jgi:hypothetical protein
MLGTQFVRVYLACWDGTTPLCWRQCGGLRVLVASLPASRTVCYACVARGLFTTLGMAAWESLLLTSSNGYTTPRLLGGSGQASSPFSVVAR